MCAFECEATNPRERKKQKKHRDIGEDIKK